MNECQVLYYYTQNDYGKERCLCVGTCVVNCEERRTKSGAKRKTSGAHTLPHPLSWMPRVKIKAAVSEGWGEVEVKGQ